MRKKRFGVSVIGMPRNGGWIIAEISMTFSKWKHLRRPRLGPDSRLHETHGTLAALEIAITIQAIFCIPKRPTRMDCFRLIRNYLGVLALVSLLLFGSQFAHAAFASAGETQKIEALIRDVRNLKDATFIRNGSAYNSKSAAIFLRRKWQANQPEVRTARDFIDKVASFSGTSGKAYLIRFKDGTEIHSRDFLMARLKTLEG